MTAERRLMSYAMAFEETLRDDDWARLDEFFADDAVYEVRGDPFTCEVHGRDAIFRAIKKSLDGFDRRCDVRRIELTKGPESRSEGDREIVTIGWAARYERGEAPTLRFDGRSVATLADGRIVHLADEYVGDDMGRVEGWLREHAPDLDLSYV